MKKTRQGISLIVLVITIIVMIILAASIIISLDNAGIINKANDAVGKSNLKQVQHIATLAWADAYADGKRSETDLKAAVDKALADNKINKDNYDIVVDKNGVTVTEKEDNNNTEDEPKEDVTPVATITLSQETITEELESGNTKTVTLTATTENVTESLVWSSNNETVATVVGNGNTATVTLKSVGTATITVTANGVTKTCVITVNGNTASVPEEWKASVREVTEDEVPIPIGFVKSPYGASENYPAENTKAGGLVIYALTEDEIKDGVTDIVAIDGKDGTLTEEEAHYESLTKRNQFVWVLVDRDDFEDLFKRSNNGWKTSSGNDKYTLSSTLGTNYWEIVLTANNMVSQNTQTDNIARYVSPATLLEATKMYESVKKYGGFYIARYEVGSKETFNDTTFGYIATRATKDDISNLSVTMGKYPYNIVAWGTSMNDETDTDNARALARAFYPSDETTYGVVSTLTYGVEWDRTLAWWEEQDALDGVDNLNLTKSTSYGAYYNTTILSADLNANAEYSIYASNKFGTWGTITQKTSGNWLLTTGAYKKANVYNIYDMAGNLSEWTMEGFSTFGRVVRGGGFRNDGSINPVAYRGGNGPTGASDSYGFRLSLYIK